MINKFQAFNLMRTSAYCEKKICNDVVIYRISVSGFVVGSVFKFIHNSHVSYAFRDLVRDVSGYKAGLMQAFAQVVESFMNAYNEKWKKENRYEVAKEQFNKDIMRNGSFISGDIIYLNDGDYGIIDSVLSDGYELFMNSSNKYHGVMSDGRGVTVFGTLDKNHSLSVDWKKTFITYLDGFQPSVKTGD